MLSFTVVRNALRCYKSANISLTPKNFLHQVPKTCLQLPKANEFPIINACRKNLFQRSVGGSSNTLLQKLQYIQKRYVHDNDRLCLKNTSKLEGLEHDAGTRYSQALEWGSSIVYAASVFLAAVSIMIACVSAFQIATSIFAIHAIAHIETVAENLKQQKIAKKTKELVQIER